MFEFHGWFVISETTYDYDIGGLDSIITDLRLMLAQADWPSGFAEIRALNGMYFLHMAGYTNRPIHYHDTLAIILTFLAKRTPGLSLIHI